MERQLPESVENNLFSNHFLRERIEDMEEWDAEVEEKFDQLKTILEENKTVLDHGSGEAETQRKFIDRVLKEVLGHYFVTEKSKRFSGELLNPDYLFLEKDVEEDVVKSDDRDEFTEAYIVGDAKDWGAPLDRGGTDHKNPAFQIYNYVDRTRIKWGILTNGQKWRLYCYDDCAADTYYEVDLIQLFGNSEDREEVLEEFKYFLLFFRKQSFFPEGEGFVDRVFQQSITYAEELEDNLEDKVYDSLELAVKGFFDTNGLEKTEENIDIVHHASLILLYRILFILNAESRHLLPVEDNAYKQAYGITSLKEKLLEDPEELSIFQSNTILWDNRISRLFEGINEGEDGLDEESIPPYNGGLFDPDYDEPHAFLKENKLSGVYLREILQRLATNYDEEKDARVTVDYRDLNIRHLGSVYEGLLEHEFEKADERKVLEDGEWSQVSESGKDWEVFDEGKRVERGELYLTNESGERKATGSYYTPEYIVEYIVENTVGPKVEEKVEEAEENGDDIITKILELNVCDPAMGSGHFLTEATQFIAEKIVENADLEGEDIEEENELIWAKRQVVQNCIYGVDINPLAVELAKLSLWIETMSRGKPLSFLDHHLKTGNSLVGSDLQELDFHPELEERPNSETDMTDIFDVETVREALRKKYRDIEAMPESTLEEIKEKEEAYKDFIENHQAYHHLKQLSNIHTCQSFESTLSPKRYREISRDVMTTDWLGYYDEDWFQKAQENAESRNYFHWELEFPKVFFGEQKGFDAIVGNPPYVTSRDLDSVDKNFYQEKYACKGAFDLYSIFIRKSIRLSQERARFSFIVPDSMLDRSSFEDLRDLMLTSGSLENLMKVKGVFDDADVANVVFVLELGRSPGGIRMGSFESMEEFKDSDSYWTANQEYYLNVEGSNRLVFLTQEEQDIVARIDEMSENLNEFLERSWRGEEKGKNSVELVDDGRPLLFGGDISRYRINFQDRFISPEEVGKEGYDSDKILVRQLGDRPNAAIDKEGYVTLQSTYNLITRKDFEEENILGLLNSRLIFFYYTSKWVEKQSFPRILLENLRVLPVVGAKSDNLKSRVTRLLEAIESEMEERNEFLDWIEAEWGVNIDDLSLKTYLREYWEHDFEEFMRVAKENESLVDGNVKSREFRELMKEEWESSMEKLRPLMKEINDLENEIDAKIFRLYELSEEEVETVLGSLDTPEEKETAILEEFESLN